MADKAPVFDEDVNNSSDVTAKLSPGSTFLLIRSYEEARIVFAVILTINAVVIVLGIIVNAVISFAVSHKPKLIPNFIREH